MKPQILLTLLLLLILQGCSNKYYYTLGDTSEIETSETYTKSIAVTKVDIPKYLKDSTIVRQVSPYQIMLIENANWLTPMQRRLTNVLINYLQKSLNNPNVHLFPWEADKDTNKKVSLKIKRFIAYKDEVILEASYKISDISSKHYNTKLFTTRVPTQEKTEAIMASMEKAYFELMETIKNELLKKEFD